MRNHVIQSGTESLDNQLRINVGVCFSSIKKSFFFGQVECISIAQRWSFSCAEVDGPMLTCICIDLKLLTIRPKTDCDFAWCTGARSLQNRKAFFSNVRGSRRIAMLSKIKERRHLKMRFETERAVTHPNLKPSTPPL